MSKTRWLRKLPSAPVHASGCPGCQGSGQVRPLHQLGCWPALAGHRQRSALHSVAGRWSLLAEWKCEMTAGSASIHSGSSAEDGACGIEAHVMLGQPFISDIPRELANTALLSCCPENLVRLLYLSSHMSYLLHIYLLRYPCHEVATAAGQALPNTRRYQDTNGLSHASTNMCVIMIQAGTPSRWLAAEEEATRTRATTRL